MMSISGLRALSLLALLLLPTAVAAKSFQELFPGVQFKEEKAQKFVESLDYKQDKVALDVGGVSLNIPAGFYFLAGADARRVITDVWGNPPATAERAIGMILPVAKTPLDDTWGAVVTFDEDGFVSDEDATTIKYDELLGSMQESTASLNEDRVKQGFPAIRLVGWASQPFYDKTSRRLHWAKELQFGEETSHTLNYDVRALGRKGVLKMNFVAEMSDLAQIKQIIPAVVSMPEFDQGSRYEDYQPGVDKVAAYGIGGLIAGKLLSKAGFLAIALAFLKKGWFIVVLAIAGLAAGLRRLFAGRSKTSA